MNRLLTCLLFVAIAISALAIPANHEPRTVKQSDGSTITVRLMGDEWHHSFVTTDGMTVVRNSAGDFCYVTASDGMSSVVAHNPEQRNSAEKTFVAANANQMTMASQYTAAKRAARESARPRRMAEVPHRGTPRIPVILVNYSDVKFISDDPATVWRNQIAGETGVSVRKYFNDQSKGKFDPQFDIYGPFDLSKTRIEYGKNVNGNDIGLGAMVAEACLGMDNDIDFSRYDNDGDGNCDVVVVLYAGGGEPTSHASDAANYIWPCQWGLYSSDYRKVLNLDNTTVNKFAVFNELYGPTMDKEDGIGTMCHEFSHCLGLPDFYETGEMIHGYFGMSVWSIMDYGNFNNNGYTPCAYNAYERNFMGWMDLDTPEPNTVYTLKDIEHGGKAYRIDSDNPDEYYIVENIQQTGWNQFAVANGLQVTHINYKQSRWTNNEVNNYADQGVTIIPADNNLVTLGSVADKRYLPGDLYPYEGNDRLTPTSEPASTLYNSSGKLNKPIYNITRNDDGTVSFFYMPDIPFAPSQIETSDVTATGFTATWNKCEGANSYTLQVTPGSRPVVKKLITESFPLDKFPKESTTDISGMLDQYMSSPGWTGNTLYPAKQGLRLGASSKTGNIVTPALDLSESQGKMTVKLTARAYSSDVNCGLRVSIGESAEDVLIADKNPQEFVLLLDCPEQTGQQVKIETTNSSHKRVIITNLEIYSGDATNELAPAVGRDGDVITITGITDTTYTVTGLKPATDYYYTVKSAFPVFDSEWSRKSFVTTLTAVKGDVTGDGAVDINDLNAVINVILGSVTAETYNGRADVTGDGTVDINDLNAVINLILGI